MHEVLLIQKLKSIRAITTCRFAEEQEEDVNTLEYTAINYTHQTQFLSGGF